MGGNQQMMGGGHASPNFSMSGPNPGMRMMGPTPSQPNSPNMMQGMIAALASFISFGFGFDEMLSLNRKC